MRLTMGTTRLDMNAKASQSTDAISAATLRATFRVVKNLKAEPNTAEIKVWNLSRDTRAALESKKLIPILLEAGYTTTGLHAIYNGQMRNAQTVRDGAAVTTSMSTGDGEMAVSAGRAFFQVPAKASPAQILGAVKQLWNAAGVGAGNIDQAGGSATFGGPARTLHGNLARVTTDVCTMQGLEWSIQDGALQFLPIGGLVKTVNAAVKLSAASGLIGSPSVDTKGIMKCKSLIQPGLMPGLPVVLDAEFVKGAYRIEEVEFTGDTWDQDWYASITGRKWA